VKIRVQRVPTHLAQRAPVVHTRAALEQSEVQLMRRLDSVDERTLSGPCLEPQVGPQQLSRLPPERTEHVRAFELDAGLTNRPRPPRVTGRATHARLDHTACTRARDADRRHPGNACRERLAKIGELDRVNDLPDANTGRAGSGERDT
jgi:hypothetical protein